MEGYRGEMFHTTGRSSHMGNRTTLNSTPVAASGRAEEWSDRIAGLQAGIVRAGRQIAVGRKETTARTDGPGQDRKSLDESGAGSTEPGQDEPSRDKRSPSATRCRRGAVCCRASFGRSPAASPPATYFHRQRRAHGVSVPLRRPDHATAGRPMRVR